MSTLIIAHLLPFAPQSPDRSEDLREGDALVEHLVGPSLQEPLVDLVVLDGGHYQHWEGGVGLVQVADHRLGALVGEGYVHDGGVYAPLGHPFASLGHRAGLGDYLQVVLLVHKVGGGLPKRRVILHEQNECDACAPHLSGCVGFVTRIEEGACLASGRIPWACGTPYELPRTPLPRTWVNKNEGHAADPRGRVPGLV